MMSSSTFPKAVKCLICSLARFGSSNGALIPAKQPSLLLSSVSSRTFSSKPLTQGLPGLTGHALRSASSLGEGSSSLGAMTTQSPGLIQRLAPSAPVVTSVRTRVHDYYKPSAWKRVNKHGIERRLRTQGGIEVLWRKYLKKRQVFSPFDRILPGTIKGQILSEANLKYNQHLVKAEVRQRVEEILKTKPKTKRVAIGRKAGHRG